MHAADLFKVSPETSLNSERYPWAVHGIFRLRYIPLKMTRERDSHPASKQSRTAFTNTSGLYGLARKLTRLESGSDSVPKSEV